MELFLLSFCKRSHFWLTPKFLKKISAFLIVELSRDPISPKSRFSRSVDTAFELSLKFSFSALGGIMVQDTRIESLVSSVR